MGLDGYTKPGLNSPVAKLPPHEVLDEYTGALSLWWGLRPNYAHRLARPWPINGTRLAEIEAELDRRMART
jgi:hypothetical protein